MATQYTHRTAGRQSQCTEPMSGQKAGTHPEQTAAERQSCNATAATVGDVVNVYKRVSVMLVSF